tara:strand:- start:671 stop:946 length:276 start_codon:yes stop_codon:yes gene_type:complete
MIRANTWVVKPKCSIAAKINVVTNASINVHNRMCVKNKSNGNVLRASIMKKRGTRPVSRQCEEIRSIAINSFKSYNLLLTSILAESLARGL